jgi:hypothetical protein
MGTPKIYIVDPAGERPAPNQKVPVCDTWMIDPKGFG